MRTILAAAFAIFLPCAASAADEPTWPAIREAVFGTRQLHDGAEVLALEAPVRAADAAIVPITVRAMAPQRPDRWIKTIWLIVDENPAPVAGVFRLTPDSGDATIATRIRVNEYTSVHAVAETSDGELHVVERFVKAAGGCSAPALKDKEVAMARLGQMRLKPMTAVQPGQLATAQLLVSHPNYSGLQMDQISRNWIPPDYVRSIKVTQAGKPLLDVEGDIALSEDPSVTFSFLPRQQAPIDVAVEDSEGRSFEKSFEVGPGS